MKLYDSIESVTTTKLLIDKDTYFLDVTLFSPYISPSGFNSRANKPHEAHYHSCVSEIDYGR